MKDGVRRHCVDGKKSSLGHIFHLWFEGTGNVKDDRKALDMISEGYREAVNDNVRDHSVL